MLIKGDIQDVIKLATELKDLADKVIEEIDRTKTFDMESYEYVDKYPSGKAPRMEGHCGSAATGSLRRKSLDLTRALAKMRKGDTR